VHAETSNQQIRKYRAVEHVEVEDAADRIYFLRGNLTALWRENIAVWTHTWSAGRSR
jgi:hypothetical protein